MSRNSQKVLPSRSRPGGGRGVRWGWVGVGGLREGGQEGRELTDEESLPPWKMEGLPIQPGFAEGGKRLCRCHFAVVILCMSRCREDLQM